MRYDDAIAWIATAIEDHLRTLPASAREPTARHARMALQVVMDAARQPAMPPDAAADDAAQRGAWAEDDVKTGGTD